MIKQRVDDDITNYIIRVGNSLKLHEETQSEAINMIKEVKGMGLIYSQNLKSIAGSALYISALMHGEKRTQKEIANVVGVIVSNIQHNYKLILTKLNEKEERKRNNAKKAKAKAKKQEKKQEMIFIIDSYIRDGLPVEKMFPREIIKHFNINIKMTKQDLELEQAQRFERWVLREYGS